MIEILLWIIGIPVGLFLLYLSITYVCLVWLALFLYPKGYPQWLSKILYPGAMIIMLISIIPYRIKEYFTRKRK